MRCVKLVLIVSVFSLSYFNVVGQKTDSDVISVMKNIEYSYFFKHLEYLASDELKGRDVGSDGYNMAADYVADEFKNNGLQPFGDNGTYFQKVEFSKGTIVKSSIQFRVENNAKLVTGTYGENISILVNTSNIKVNETQELVFVGYGNILPKESINDYEGVDVKDKTVIVALGGPKSLSNPAFGDISLKLKNAVSNGATGIILYYPKGRALQNMIFKRIHGFLSSPTLVLADTSIGGAMFGSDLKIGAFVKREFVKDILKLNGIKFKRELKNISKGENSSKELETVLKCSFDVNVKNIDCKNVVAVLPGTDSILKNEYVVLTAHLDHLGVGREIKGDSIYNGMWDNASGSAGVISIAKAYNELAEKPKRSVVFVCLTAEEKGLLGSNYYANINEITDGKIVANLNVDMLGGLHETKDIIPLGYSYSNLSEAVDYSSEILNIAIDDNKEAEKEYIQRSDQFSFIKTGVPVLNLGHGMNAVNPKINGEKTFNKWMDEYYHSPFDDLNQEYDDEAFLVFIKLHFLTLYYMTNSIEEIKWNEESWIYKKYVLKEKSKLN